MSEDKTYDPVDFATDEEFILWVKAGAREDDPYWRELNERAPGKEAEIREAIQIVRQIRLRTRPENPAKIQQIWQQIDQKTKTEPQQTAKRRKLWSLQNAVMTAAAVAILFLGFFFFIQQPQKVKTAFAEQTEHMLPDGSLVYLNADSRVTYHEKKWEKERTLKLEGEAFFEVEKGSTFEVQTKLGNVRVLGTSFNVRARKKLDVSCFTGQVEVEAVGQQAVKLVPGQRVYQEGEADTLKRENFDPADKKYWRRGALSFSAATLETVFDELERSFDIEIVRPLTIEKRKFSGSVTLEDIENALQDVCAPMQLRFEKQDNRYRILD